MQNPIYHQKLQAIKSNNAFVIEPITSSIDSFNAALLFWEEDIISIQECFYALYLNNNAKPICFAQIAKGAINACIVDIRLLLTHALLSNAVGLIIYHNHPSGNTNPSQQDIDLTQKIQRACEHMNIKLYDHIILTPENNYYSFADNGHL
jgi:DNA repair protein RadC